MTGLSHRYHGDMSDLKDFDPQMPVDRHLWSSRFPGGLQEEGHLLAEDLPRLVAEGIDLPDGLAWQMQFQKDQLVVSAQARVSLPCVRCLQPVDVALATVRRYRLFDQASQADESLDMADEDTQTLATEDRLSLAHLLEDEIMLLAADRPMHQDCQMTLPDQPRPDNPFAILAKLK
jgi:uncharacterized metal-binding protein YceD (DUF177 family)